MKQDKFEDIVQTPQTQGLPQVPFNMVDTSDQAKAQAVMSLKEYDHTKIPVLTDLTERHINLISGLYTVDKWLKKNDCDSLITETALSQLVVYRISKQRKGRKEIKEVVKSSDALQEGGMLSRVKDRFF